jgi:hypothetical protein
MSIIEQVLKELHYDIEYCYYLLIEMNNNQSNPNLDLLLSMFKVLYFRTDIWKTNDMNKLLEIVEDFDDSILELNNKVLDELSEFMHDRLQYIKSLL